MKKIFIACIAFIIVSLGITNKAAAQCTTTAVPTISSGCSVEWFVSMSASGTGVSSTISLTGGSCPGTGAASYYFNDYTTQGITAPAGSTVNMDITRYTTHFAGYISVYVDWNNDGNYDPTELAGTVASLSTTTLTTTYTFTIPTTGIVLGTNLHMRVFLSELATGAPCTGNYGQAYDYYLNATCPANTITFSPAHDTLCSGGSSIITASGAGTGATYTWSPATGLSATTGATLTVSAPATTVYTVTGTSSLGCSYISTDTVAVVPGGGPVDTVITSDSTHFCAGDSAWLHGSVGATYTYQWYNGSTLITGATDSTYKATASGSYTLQITIPSGCSSLSPAVAITVFNPTPVITRTGNTLRTDNYYTSYQWYENGTLISGATHDSTIIHSNGNYTVKVTDTNGCTGTSAMYTVAHLAVQGIAANKSISIYPNPASKTIYISAAEKVDAIIYNAGGKKVIEQKNATAIDISALPAGVYSIEVFDNNKVQLAAQSIIKN